MAEGIIVLSHEDLDQFRKEVLDEVKALKDDIASSKFNYMRSKDVMQELGISSSTLQKMRIRGEIPFTKLGDTILYPRQEVKQILIGNMKNVA